MIRHRNLARHRRHYFLERPHDGFESLGDLVVRVHQAPHATLLRIELDEQAVALFSQEAHLLLQRGDGNTTLPFDEYAAQKDFQLIDSGIESLRSLLQSIRLTHCAAPPRLGARQFTPPAERVPGQRSDDNVVTISPTFNNDESPSLVSRLARLTAPRAL